MRARRRRATAAATRPPGAAAPLPRVDFWAIWNEPNYGPDLAPQAIDALDGRGLPAALPRAARRRLDARCSATGHGRDTILIGELAPRGHHAPATARATSTAWSRCASCARCTASTRRCSRCAAPRPRSAAARRRRRRRRVPRRSNPALFEASGFADPPVPAGSRRRTSSRPDEPDYADLAALPQARARRSTRLPAAYGSSTRFPIYSTEFGYQTNPAGDVPGTVSPTTAPLYLTGPSTSPGATRGSAPTTSTCSPTRPARRLRHRARVRRRAGRRPPMPPTGCRCFLRVASGSAGTPLEVWGGVRPAGVAGAPDPHATARSSCSSSRRARSFQDHPRITLKDPYGYFDLRRRGSERSRLAASRWQYPGGDDLQPAAFRITIR